MSNSTKSMLIWGGLYFLMLLTLLTPLSFITINLMMIPLLVLFVILDLKRFILLVAAIYVILMVFLGSGGIMLSLMSLFFLIPSIAMGIQYRKGASSGAAVTTGIITLISLLLLLLMLSTMLGMNITNEFTRMLKSDPNLMAMINSIVKNEEQLDMFIELMISMIPMMIIMIAVYYTIITHWLGRKLLTRLREQPVPKLKPMKEWKLPRSLVWFYLIVLILDLILVVDTDSAITVIVLNSLPLLIYAFGLQAIGFCFFFADLKGWNRTLPRLTFILLLVMPSLLAWIGVIDVTFKLRSWVTEKVNGAGAA